MARRISAVLLAGVSAAAIAGAARADVVISKQATANMSCAAGVCSPTAAKATLNATDLTNMLASGDVKVTTGNGATSIVVKDGFSWTSTSRLTLDAMQSVAFEKPVTVAGSGAVTITTNDGGSGGDLLFGDKGNLTLWDLSSNLVINGNSYTLVGDIQTLAADIAANPAGFYALANAYNARHETFETVPVPTSLSGSFEGLGQAISHLKIKGNEAQCEGFFGTVLPTGVVRDIDLTRATVSTAGATSAGTLVGCNQGLITNIRVDGTVGGMVNGGAMGGAVGSNTGAVIGATSAVVVSCSDDGAIGGLAGASFGVVARSIATGPVAGTSESAIGGLFGSGTGASQSYATGNVTGGDKSFVGGLIGSGSNIVQSYATGNVIGSRNVVAGGLVGVGHEIQDSYAKGSVTAEVSSKSILGGLVGKGFDIADSYSTGAPSGGNINSVVGGFVGKGDKHPTFTEDYWDTDTSLENQGCGAGNCTGVSGLTTEQLQSGLPAGFDPSIWAESSERNNGLPYLKALPPK